MKLIDSAEAAATGAKRGVAQAETAMTQARVPGGAKTCRMYGYVRVSTREQNEARQIDAMKTFGVDVIFLDKQSGKDFERPEYRRLIRRLRAGDVLVVKSIDRLGRNYEEILEQWRMITKQINASIVVLDMPLLDTRRGRDLTGTLIADIVLQLLSYVAETERNFIKQRQREGIAAAKARGQRFGPPMKDRPDNLGQLIDLWSEGTISARQAASQLNVAHTTFLKWARAETPEGASRARSACGGNSE